MEGPAVAASRNPPTGRARALRRKQAWVLYILRCADGSLYTGITNALEHRLERHRAGTGSKYTRSRLPVALIWTRSCRTGREARSLEYAVKSLPRSDKLRLVEGRLEL